MVPRLAPARRRLLLWAALCLACLSPLRATTVIPPTFEELVNESDYVVRAVVESTRAEYRDTAQGRIIMTFVQLRVREIVAGQPPARIELELVGGRIGDDRLVLVGAPTFAVGDEDFLFVRDNGRNVHPLFALMHGRYPVLRDQASGAEYVARSNAVPLQDVAEIALPVAEGGIAALQQRRSDPASALTPARFSSLIKAARRPDYVRQRLH